MDELVLLKELIAIGLAGVFLRKLPKTVPLGHLEPGEGCHWAGG